MAKKKRTGVSTLKFTGARRRHSSVDHGFLPENWLPYAFSVVTNRVSSMLERMYGERYQLSVTGWRLIAVLASHAPLSSKALAELTAMDQVAVSRAVDQLVFQKYVSRRADPTDGRRVVIRLTRKGAEIYRTIMPLARGIEAALIAGLPDQRVRMLRRAMDFLLQRSREALSDERDWRALLPKTRIRTSKPPRLP